eukprot:8364282-Pyramimonas_sp.AAC.1
MSKVAMMRWLRRPTVGRCCHPDAVQLQDQEVSPQAASLARRGDLAELVSHFSYGPERPAAGQGENATPPPLQR